MVMKKKKQVEEVDKYVFNLEKNIRTFYNSETCIVEVVTICNTSNIITMYPTLNQYKYSLAKNNSKIKIRKNIIFIAKLFIL